MEELYLQRLTTNLLFDGEGQERYVLLLVRFLKGVGFEAKRLVLTFNLFLVRYATFYWFQG